MACIQVGLVMRHFKTDTDELRQFSLLCNASTKHFVISVYFIRDSYTVPCKCLLRIKYQQTHIMHSHANTGQDRWLMFTKTCDLSDS